MCVHHHILPLVDPSKIRGAQTTYKAHKPVAWHSHELPPKALTDFLPVGHCRLGSAGLGRQKFRCDLARDEFWMLVHDLLELRFSKVDHLSSRVPAKDPWLGLGLRHPSTGSRPTRDPS